MITVQGTNNAALQQNESHVTSARVDVPEFASSVLEREGWPGLLAFVAVVFLWVHPATMTSSLMTPGQRSHSSGVSRGVSPGAARRSPQLTHGGFDCQPCPGDVSWMTQDGVVVNVHDVLECVGLEGDLSRRRRRRCLLRVPCRE